MFLNDIKYNWIGDIPKNWEVKRIKNLFFLKKEVSENPEQEQVLSLTMNGIIKRDVSSNEGQLPDTYKGYTKIYPDDIVMNPMDLKSGWIDRSKYDGIISPSYYVLNKLNDDLDIQFFNYQLQRHYKERIFFSFGQGVSYDYRWGIGRETILNFPIIVPPLNTQTQIVSFLDTKTQKTDELIEKTEQKIKLLKEKRTSLINHCVTKGLNPEVEMKDSGVEWIGKIPRGWGLIKLRYYLNKVGSGVTPRGGGDVYSDEGIKFLRSQNIHFDGLHLSDVVFITESIYEKMKNSQVNKGDVLLNITGGSIGRCCVIDTNEKFNLNQHVSILRTKSSLYNYFLNYNLMSSIGQEQVLYNQTGGNREGLTSENIKNFKIGFPSLSEQIQIVEYLDEQTQKIDSTIEKETQRIELLKEYRQSLISEVVTGKVDVRDWDE